MNKKLLFAAAGGLLVFIAAIFLAKGLVYFFPEGPIWLGQVLMKAILIVLSLLGIRFVLQSSFSEAGFRKPVIKMKKAQIVLAGMGLGALGTVLIFFTPAEGVPLIKKLNLLEFLLIVVFWSSLAEEIFIRGLLQTYLQPLENKKVRIASYSVSVSVLACAAAFGGMHLSLIFAEVDLYSVSITVLGTFFLGLLAGILKEKYKSIVPAFLAHLSFNLGAVVTGIVIAILFKIITGELPPH